MLDPRTETPHPGDGTYREFATEVARRQLALWLQERTGPIADLTPHSPSARATAAPVVALRHDLSEVSVAAVAGIRGDDTRLDCLRSASLGAVVAEQGALSDCLLVEETLSRVHRVLRPGGSVLLCVDSVVFGMAALAAAGRWAELADAPQADVVLVGDYTKGLTRCFSPKEIATCAIDAGLVVDWVRPRTVLSAETVRHALETDPTAMPSLVSAELRLWARNTGEAAGHHLLMSAHRPR